LEGVGQPLKTDLVIRAPQRESSVIVRNTTLLTDAEKTETETLDPPIVVTLELRL